MSPTLLLVLIVLGLLLIISVGIYNGLVRLHQQVARAWANIDVILKQRFDELSSLIQITEQFSQYERDIVSQLVEARKHYGAARSTGDKIKASQEISVALGGVLALGENYPELKSNQNFLQLQGRISALEDGLADRRETYNEYVTTFNTRIMQVPHIIFANMLGYRNAEMFQVSESEKQMPSLKMNLGLAKKVP